MASQAAAHLESAVKKIFRPLLAIFIRAGYRFENFLVLIRGVYIDAAIAEGRKAGEDFSRAKLSVLTGISRRDVDAYLDSSEGIGKAEPTNAYLIAEVLALWYSDSDFLGPYGMPLELDLQDTEGRNFSVLVRRLNKIKDPNKLLEEMLETGIVVRAGDRHFRPKARTFLFSDPLSAIAFEHLGMVMSNLANTLNRNLVASSEPKLLERSVFSDHGLTKSQLPEFHAYARERVQELIVDLDGWFAMASTKIANERDTKFDVGISIFEYEHPTGTSLQPHGKIEIKK